MRFVHVLADSADPNSANGVNKVVHWLAETQTKSGHQAEVWALKPEPSPATHQRSYSITVFETARLRFLRSPELNQALNKLTPDTWVHLHSVYIPELTAIAHKLKSRGVLYGVTPHGGYLSTYFDPLKVRAKKTIFATLWENWMLRNAAMVHLVGATEVDDLRRRAPHTKTYIIPNGYRREKPILNPGPRKESDPPCLIYCGRHEIKQKGLDLLLLGFSDYRKQGGTLRLLMIGAGEDHVRLRSMSKDLDVSEAVTWPGPLYGDELHKVLRGAAAFVHTSRFEGLPTACLEAAALGVPLFLSPETNFGPYLPAEAGWIYTPNTPERIAATMFRIQNTPPPHRITMGKNAQRMIDEDLQWDRICNRFQEAVSECMQKAGKIVA